MHHPSLTRSLGVFGLIALFVGLVSLASVADNSAHRPMPPRHVLTADYAGGPRYTSVDPKKLAPWLSWASTSWQANRAVVGAGIKAMLYTNPNRIQPKDQSEEAEEAKFAHDCGGSRVKSTFYENQYLLDPSSSSTLEAWRKAIDFRSKGAHWDAIFDDDANSVEALTALPCNYAADAWADATYQEIKAVKLPVIYNGLQNPTQRKLNSLPNVLGGMYEGCYSDSAKRPKIYDDYWVKIENAELFMAHDRKLFFCLGRDGTAAKDAIDGRIYTLASFLLTYSVDSSVLWETYSTPSLFRVEPESALVPTAPTVGAPDSVGKLLRGGVFAREYGACYVSGSLVGPCAVAVNPDSTQTHSYPFGARYTHTIRLQGGGVIDGGTIREDGPPPQRDMPPLSAYVVFQ